MATDRYRNTPAATAWAMLALVATQGPRPRAQSPHPFAAPVTSAAFSLNGTGAIADVNRDGSPDVVCPGLFFGTYATSLDEDGAPLAVNVPGPFYTPIPGAPTLPFPVAMTAGDLDGDGRDDLVSVTTAGGLHVHRNLGASRLDACWFAQDTIVDCFLSRFPISPPMVNYSFPVARVLDLDGDGRNDILIAGGPMDRWNGATRPGFVGFYRQLPNGAFEHHLHLLTGCAIDLAVGDFDHDGRPDHLVVVVETGAVGAFVYEVLHLQWNGSQLAAAAPPFVLTPGRCTALALADVAGDGNLDYVFAHTVPSGTGTFAMVQWIQGNGQGTLAGAPAGLLPLPQNLTSLSEFAAAIVAGDFDRDGHDDLAILRGFVQPVAPSVATGTTWADSEVLVAMGPNAAQSPCAILPLPGYQMFSSTQSTLFPLLPLQPQPGFLRAIDLRGDGNVDLMAMSLRPQSPTAAPTQLAVLRNTTPAQVGAPAIARLGAASGGNPARPARLGFEGGPPRAGNAQFAATLLNVQGGSVAGLVWGPLGIENLFVAYGIDVHIVPDAYFGAIVASGSGPGGGFARQSLPIPNLPALAGDAGWFQWAYWDPAAGAFGGSHASSVRIAP